jgi:hypothetical protein
MNNQNENHDNGRRFPEELELTAAERKALEKLRKDVLPGDLLEERIVDALYERGLLSKPHRRAIEITLLRSVAAAAACLVLLATGFIIGQWSVSQHTSGTESIEQANTDFLVAASVQQTGSAYLMALQRLASRPVGFDSSMAIQGQEVALNSLCTAAGKVARMVPGDMLSGQLLAFLDGGKGISRFEECKDFAIDHNLVIEF